MGTYENQLTAIATGANWNIQKLGVFLTGLGELQTAMATIAASPGWTGISAEFAQEKFLYLQGIFKEMEIKATATRDAIVSANSARTAAGNAHAGLPDATVPEWIHLAAKAGGTALIPVPFVGEFMADSIVSEVNKFMGAQREAAAYKAMENLGTGLETPEQQLRSSRINVDVEWPTPSPPPPGPGVTWPGDATGKGGWSTNSTGSYTGNVTGTGEIKPPPIKLPPSPPIVLPPECPPGWPNNVVRPPTIGVDGDLTTGSTGGGGGGFGGGMGGGLAAGLAGAGALGAGAKLASTGSGAGGLFGANGILGGGANAAGGAGAGGAGAGAGGKSSAMMGGAPGGAGGGEKDKRSSLGLVAPKLEDDEETGPRSAAAGAGGRA